MKKIKNCWITAIDSDSFNYVPQKVNDKEAKKEGFKPFYREADCQHACDILNSM